MTPSSAPSTAPDLCTATLVLVPPRTDRLRMGRDLAASRIGGQPHGQTLARRGIHPDVIELTPPEKKERIGIAQVRELIRVAQFTPVQADRKLCLIPRAESLTPEAANALLKILEEPPRGLVFVLLAEHSGDLLPTIASRSRIIRLAPEPSSNLAEQLIDCGYTASQAAWIDAITTRDNEIAPFLAECKDMPSLHKAATGTLARADAPDLIKAMIGEDPIHRAVAFRNLIRRLTARDAEMLTHGVRFLAAQSRETVFLFLQELLAASFTLLRAQLASKKEDPEEEARLTAFCHSIDQAHEALSSYSPAEALLLSLFLVPGGGIHAG